jgi:PIN domain nuclease of toxin-antitoxin system
LNLLLDTHALIWFATDLNHFDPDTLQAIYDADRVLVSPVSAYEMTVKITLGKLPVARRLLSDLSGYLERQRFNILPLSLAHAEAAGRLPLDHRDPFDRLLAAQALSDDLTLVSSDTALDRFGVKRLW